MIIHGKYQLLRVSASECYLQGQVAHAKPGTDRPHCHFQNFDDDWEKVIGAWFGVCDLCSHVIIDSLKIAFRRQNM